jgi:hypothetical protein
VKKPETQQNATKTNKLMKRYNEWINISFECTFFTVKTSDESQ